MTRLLALALLGACLPLAAAAATVAPAAELPEPGTYELPPIARVPDFGLLDSTGGTVPLLGLAPGQLAVVALIYTSCPSACPAALAILQQVDREVAREPTLNARVRIVTLSFDPEYDTPAKMAALRERMSPQSDWRFLTSESEEAVRPVLDAFGQDALRLVTAGDTETPLMRHVLKVYLVDDTGDVRNIYSTGLLSKDMVLTDIRTLLQAAEADSALARD